MSPHALRDITTTANNAAARPSGFWSPNFADTRKTSSNSTSQDHPSSSPSLSRPHHMMPTECSRATSQQGSYTQSKPWTPNEANNSISKRKNWMSSASKRLGINSSKSRKAIPTISSPLITSPSPYSNMKRPEVSLNGIPVNRSNHLRYLLLFQSNVQTQYLILDPLLPHDFKVTRSLYRVCLSPRLSQALQFIDALSSTLLNAHSGGLSHLNLDASKVKTGPHSHQNVPQLIPVSSKCLCPSSQASVRV
jgi:hypothetical protein